MSHYKPLLLEGVESPDGGEVLAVVCVLLEWYSETHAFPQAMEEGVLPGGIAIYVLLLGHVSKIASILLSK